MQASSYFCQCNSIQNQAVVMFFLFPLILRHNSNKQTNKQTKQQQNNNNDKQKQKEQKKNENKQAKKGGFAVYINCKKIIEE